MLNNAIVLIAAAAVLWYLYRAALPKPIPGIPYRLASAQHILGDVPLALRHYAQTSELISFLIQRCEELQSPLVQVFMRPFHRPWVILLDAWEAQDVMGRRAREFDRADFFREMFEVTFPHNQVHMPTNDQWRFNRQLVGDAMSPSFLNQVAALQVHSSTLDLILLWRHKLRLSKGRTIDVAEDIRMCTVDTIWAATFGVNLGSCRSQTQHLYTLDGVLLPDEEDGLLQLPVVTPPAAYLALKSVARSSEIPLNSPFGRSHHWFAARFYPRLRWAIRHKDKLIREQVNNARNKFDKDTATADMAKYAVDLVIEREATLARKGGRAPSPHSSYIHDELGGFLNAGFETTSTTISWGLKFLARHADVQQRLRKVLNQTFREAVEIGTHPSARDITNTSMPYLDAVIEEILRCSSVIPANMRAAVVDTQILGYHIPKGTNIFMPTSGPSFTKAPMAVNEQKRSHSSREFYGNSQNWASQNLAEFDPQRWLKRNSGGNLVFDGHAAPQQMFGVGIRSCFGRRLGYLEMRIILTLLIWNFELLPPPVELIDFKAIDGTTHQPQNVYIRLASFQPT